MFETPRPVAPAAEPSEQARSEFDATAFLTVYLILLLLIPSNLIVKALGAAGTPANLFGIIGLVWWGATRLVPRQEAGPPHQPVRVALAFLTVAVLASYAAVAIRPADAVELSSADRGLLLLMAWSGPALIAADGIISRARLEVLLRRLCVLGSIVAFTGIVAFAFHYDIRSVYSIPGLVPNSAVPTLSGAGAFARVAGLAGHPIEFGVLLAMILPIALHFAFEAPREYALRWWTMVCLIGAAIPMAISRSASLGALVAGLIVAAGWTWRRRLNALCTTAIFLVVMRLIVPGLLGSVKSLFTSLGTDDSIRGRTDDYGLVGKFISERPVFGRGFQTFIPTKYFFLDNQFLGVIIEIGFFGLLAVTTFVLTGIVLAGSARHRSTDPSIRDLAQALTASIAVVAVGFFTFDVFGFAMVSGMLFLTVGICGALWRLTERRRVPRHDLPPVKWSPAEAPSAP